jgi:hypothetical protein
MDYPIINAVRGRSRQAMSMALGTATDVASRGMGTVRAFGLRCRPGIMGLGVSSTLASAGQEGRSRFY